MKILKNEICCKHCGNTIGSFNINDVKWCECGMCAVAGGNQELIRYFKSDVAEKDYVDLAEVENE
nr:MAG TPA: 60S ribosomal protein L2-A [Caudoviricetes sp.]